LLFQSILGHVQVAHRHTMSTHAFVVPTAPSASCLRGLGRASAKCCCAREIGAAISCVGWKSCARSWSTCLRMRFKSCGEPSCKKFREAARPLRRFVRVFRSLRESRFVPCEAAKFPLFFAHRTAALPFCWIAQRRSPCGHLQRPDHVECGHGDATSELQKRVVLWRIVLRTRALQTRPTNSALLVGGGQAVQQQNHPDCLKDGASMDLLAATRSLKCRRPFAEDHFSQIWKQY
jgi:hypothetical protein